MLITTRNTVNDSDIATVYDTDTGIKYSAEVWDGQARVTISRVGVLDGGRIIYHGAEALYFIRQFANGMYRANDAARVELLEVAEELLQAVRVQQSEREPLWEMGECMPDPQETRWDPSEHKRITERMRAAGLLKT